MPQPYAAGKGAVQGCPHSWMDTLPLPVQVQATNALSQAIKENGAPPEQFSLRQHDKILQRHTAEKKVVALKYQSIPDAVFIRGDLKLDAVD